MSLNRLNIVYTVVATSTSIAASVLRNSLPVPAEHRVDDHPPRFLDVNKLMERIMTFRRACPDASCTQVEI